MNLNGTWRVKVLSGPLWFRAMNLIRDRKIIDGDSGYNIACGVKWGRFTIQRRLQRLGRFNELKIVLLKYKDQPIVDVVTYADENKLIGQFYRKNSKYVGDFEMVRER